MTLLTGLTGNGSAAFSSAENSGILRVAVTNLGMAHAMDVGPPTRYVDIGWLAFYEANPHSDELPPGNYLLPHFWIEYEFSTIDVAEFVNAIAGVDGVYWSLRAGVEITLRTTF